MDFIELYNCMAGFGLAAAVAPVAPEPLIIGMAGCGYSYLMHHELIPGLGPIPGLGTHGPAPGATAGPGTHGPAPGGPGGTSVGPAPAGPTPVGPAPVGPAPAGPTPVGPTLP